MKEYMISTSNYEFQIRLENNEFEETIGLLNSIFITCKLLGCTNYSNYIPLSNADNNAEWIRIYLHKGSGTKNPLMINIDFSIKKEITKIKLVYLNIKDNYFELYGNDLLNNKSNIEVLKNILKAISIY